MNRMEATADLLADGYEPDEIALLPIAVLVVRKLINDSVHFHLVAANVDRPNADKYGTHPDGSPRYAPEWYMAQAVATAIHEGLHGTLSDVLKCESVDEHGHKCTGSLMHVTNHWDGNGCNWIEVSS